MSNSINYVSQISCRFIQIGLEYIHPMTRKNEYMLRVDLEDNYGVKAYAEYTTFSVNSETDKAILIGLV